MTEQVEVVPVPELVADEDSEEKKKELTNDKAYLKSIDGKIINKKTSISQGNEEDEAASLILKKMLLQSPIAIVNTMQ